MQDRIKGDFLRWLRGFHAVADTGSVSDAAERLGLRQPSVSHLVRCLEDDLGVQLFTRHKKSMLLTDEGRQLFEKTISLLEIVKEIQSEVGRSDATTYKGTVSFATTHSVAVNILPRQLLRFSTRHPATHFSIVSGVATNYTVDNVIGATIDFGIASGREFPDVVLPQPLFSTRLILIAPKTMPFARDRHGYLKSLSDLHDVPFLDFTEGRLVPHYIASHITAKGIQPRRAIVTNNSSVLKAYVSAGIGVAIVEEFAFDRRQDTYDSYPLPGEAAISEYFLLTRQRKYLPPQSAAFINQLLQSVRDNDIAE